MDNIITLTRQPGHRPFERDASASWPIIVTVAGTALFWTAVIMWGLYG